MNVRFDETLIMFVFIRLDNAWISFDKIWIIMEKVCVIVIKVG